MKELSSSRVYIFLRSCRAILLHLYPAPAQPHSPDQPLPPGSIPWLSKMHTIMHLHFLSIVLCFSRVSYGYLHFPQFTHQASPRSRSLTFSSISGSTNPRATSLVNSQIFRTKRGDYLLNWPFASFAKWLSYLSKSLLYSKRIRSSSEGSIQRQEALTFPPTMRSPNPFLLHLPRHSSML